MHTDIKFYAMVFKSKAQRKSILAQDSMLRGTRNTKEEQDLNSTEA